MIRLSKNLTTSKLDRQNILNNEKALVEIQNQIGIQGIKFENKVYFTKTMLSTYFEVDIRTIERYVSDNVDELSSNGYEIIKGKRLKNFIDEIEKLDVPDINVGNISNRTSQLAIFDFRSFLDLAMMLVESQPAKSLLIKKLVVELNTLIKEIANFWVLFYRKKIIEENLQML